MKRVACGMSALNRVRRRAELVSRVFLGSARSRCLLGDDQVLDVVVDVLGHDLAVEQLVLALVGATFDDRVGARFADALSLMRSRGTRVEVSSASVFAARRGAAPWPTRVRSLRELVAASEAPVATRSAMASAAMSVFMDFSCLPGGWGKRRGFVASGRCPRNAPRHRAIGGVCPAQDNGPRTSLSARARGARNRGYLSFVSLYSTCLRATGSNFLISIFSGIGLLVLGRRVEVAGAGRRLELDLFALAWSILRGSDVLAARAQVGEHRRRCRSCRSCAARRW